MAHKHEEAFVIQHQNGWAVKKPNAERSSGVFDTRAEAIRRARELAGKGAVHIQSRNGRFRSETPYDE